MYWSCAVGLMEACEKNVNLLDDTGSVMIKDERERGWKSHKRMLKLSNEPWYVWPHHEMFSFPCDDDEFEAWVKLKAIE